MGVLIGSAVIPVTLSIMWKRVTAQGMIYGPIAGTISGLIVWLIVASTYPGGLGDFLTNTGRSMVGKYLP